MNHPLRPGLRTVPPFLFSLQATSSLVVVDSLLGGERNGLIYVNSRVENGRSFLLGFIYCVGNGECFGETAVSPIHHRLSHRPKATAEQSAD